MPLAGLDLSSGARAGLTAFLAGVSRQVAASNVTINFMLPGTFETDRLHANLEGNAKRQNITFEQSRTNRHEFASRPSGSAARRNSERLALFFARRRPATSRGRIF